MLGAWTAGTGPQELGRGDWVAMRAAKTATGAVLRVARADLAPREASWAGLMPLEEPRRGVAMTSATLRLVTSLP